MFNIKLYSGLCAMDAKKRLSNESCSNFDNKYHKLPSHKQFVICLGCDHFKFPKIIKQKVLGEI